MGCPVPLTYCCKTAPTAVSDASVIKCVGASALGKERRGAFAKASFVALKAARAVTLAFQVSVWDFGVDEVMRV